MFINGTILKPSETFTNRYFKIIYNICLLPVNVRIIKEVVNFAKLWFLKSWDMSAQAVWAGHTLELLLSNNPNKLRIQKQTCQKAF